MKLVSLMIVAWLTVHAATGDFRVVSSVDDVVSSIEASVEGLPNGGVNCVVDVGRLRDLRTMSGTATDSGFHRARVDSLSGKRTGGSIYAKALAATGCAGGLSSPPACGA